MKKILVIAAVLTLCATSAFAVTDTFSYSDGNLNGNGGWTGSDAGSIVVTSGTVKITSNATGKTDANLAAPVSASTILVSYDYQMAAGNPEFFADVYAKDAAGKYLGWMYMAPEGYWTDNGVDFFFANGIVRGRGPEGIVVYTVAAGDYAWHNYKMIIDTVANTTAYYVDATLIGTRNQESGAGDSLASLQLTSWNRGHTASFGYFDNVSAVPEPGSMLALLSGLVGVVGFARRRK